MSDLTKQQEAFCLEYINNGLNGKQAYMKCYPRCKSEQGAEVGASQLIRNHKVSKRLKELQNEIRNDKLMSIHERRKWLCKVISEEVKEKSTRFLKDGTESIHEKPASLFDKMKALDMLNKMDGAYTENINANVTNMNPLAEFSKEELKNEIEKLKDK